MKKSFRGLASIPGGSEIRRILRLLIHISRDPYLLMLVVKKIEEMVGKITQQYFSSKTTAYQYINEKNYVVLVGYQKMSQEDVYLIGKRFGFKSCNIKIIDDLNELREMKTRKLLKDDHCVAFFLGNLNTDARVTIFSLFDNSVCKKIISNQLTESSFRLDLSFRDLLARLHKACCAEPVKNVYPVGCLN